MLTQRLIRSVVAFAATCLLAVPATASATGTGEKNKHVTICHATGSDTNPYVQISPSKAGVVNGHYSHQDGRDIIPPFDWRGQHYDGKNWPSGQATWNNGCVPPAGSTPPPQCGGEHNSCPPPPCPEGTHPSSDGKMCVQDTPPANSTPIVSSTTVANNTASNFYPIKVVRCDCPPLPKCKVKKKARKCPTRLRGKAVLYGPKVVGPSPWHKFTFRVMGPHIERVAFYVDGKRKRIDYRSKFIYATIARDFRGSKHIPIRGVHTLRAVVFFAKCAKPTVIELKLDVDNLDP